MTELSVDTMEDTMSILQRGAQGRTVGSTAMNSSSSRSHAIFTLHIERTNKKDRSVLLWVWDKLAIILQTTFWNAFSSMRMLKYVIENCS